MSGSLGDFDLSTVIYFKFTTYRPSTGAAYTLAGTPAISVYKDASTTQSTSGVTLTADFDSVTGLNHVAIDTSSDGTFYSSGSFFDVVITTGTVDSVSVVGSVVGRFNLRKTSAIKPTTAGRTLDVSAGGEAGVDWANVGSPTTTLSLTGTTVATATNVTNAVKTLDVLLTGTASAGSTTTITLAGGVATDDYYTGCAVVITGNTGAGQTRTILSYVGSTKVATLTRNWETAPDGTSVFAVFGADVPDILEAGRAQAGANSSITLDAGASASDAVYVSNSVMITAGTGAGQTRLITGYVGSTKIATITPSWTVNPDSTSVYQIVPGGRVDVGLWRGSVPNTLISGRPDVNTQAVAATLVFDQTGSVSGSVGSVIGAVGSVTGNVGGNVVGTVASVVGAVGSVTGAVGSVTATVNADVKKINAVTIVGDGSATPFNV